MPRFCVRFCACAREPEPDPNTNLKENFCLYLISDCSNISPILGGPNIGIDLMSLLCLIQYQNKSPSLTILSPVSDLKG